VRLILRSPLLLRQSVRWLLRVCGLRPLSLTRVVVVSSIG